VALLESQLGAAKQELEMEREQHELDSQDLVDQNERLRSKASTLQSKAKLSEKRAAAAEQSLALRKSSEAQEADVLETFTAAVEKKLQASEARVGAATPISTQSHDRLCCVYGCCRVNSAVLPCGDCSTAIWNRPSV
jgi:hypothetical protein